MKNILSEIIENKKKEVEERKSLCPVKLLEKSIFFNTQPVSLKKYLLRKDKSGIIAEFKTKSPSKGEINPYAQIEKISVDYMKAGASALSVLTDNVFFGGSFKNLTTARKYNYCPILQKDFFIDEYQIIEAKSIGADAILLIASVLSKSKLQSMSQLAFSLGMEVLFEVSKADEIQKLNTWVEIVGVNNRDLNSFKTDSEKSELMATELPDNLVKVSESGISSVESVQRLKSVGYSGFLVGESFMKTNNPGKACKYLIDELNQNNVNRNNKNQAYETQSLRNQ